LFLGDSFTFGFGVEEGSKRFSDLVESELNIDANQNASASHYHIYNAGVAGTEPEEWLDYLKTLQPLYQPDYVFVIFFLRDGTRLCTSLHCHEEVINGIKSKYTERFLYRYSYLGQFIYSSFIRKEFSDYYEAQVLNSYLGNEEEQAFWREQQQYLLEIRDISEQNGVEFHLVIFPILIDLNGRYPFRQVDEEIIRFANEADISVYSMTDGFIGQDAPSLWVSPTDQHPNEKGHAVAADILFPYVRDIVTP
jgi:lysophospholipase L1-like esterase